MILRCLNRLLEREFNAKLVRVRDRPGIRWRIIYHHEHPHSGLRPPKGKGSTLPTQEDD